MDFTGDSDWLHSDALELLSTLEKTELEGSEGLAPLDDTADLDASYLEAFTDLSDLLGDCSNQGAGTAMEGADALWDTPENVHVIVPVAEPREILPQTSLAEPLPPSPSSSTTSSTTSAFPWSALEGRAAAKRTAQVAFGSAELAPSNPDHNDYILKRKKFRESAPPSSTSSSSSAAADSTTKPKTKAQKYTERRKKNNVASKRSRETRKQKFTEMELQAIQLEEDNEALRVKVTMLERMAKEMKDTLVQKLAQGK